MNELIEKFINENEVTKYNYEFFNNFEEISSGPFGTVHKATWGDKVIVLKSLNINIGEIINKNETKKTEITNETKNEMFIQAFVNELRILLDFERHKHPNIIQFYGVTKDAINGRYNLVLQLAADGNLREYLRENFGRLKWSDKLRFAQEIAEGLSFLHGIGIFHRDLHSKNILVHNERMLIADFGISKYMNEVSMVKAQGMWGYLDPQCFNPHLQHKCDKRSDIYSFGVILWEIISGRPPYKSFVNIAAIGVYVHEGKREDDIKGTPIDYEELYKRCWDQDPDKRPEISEVIEDLKRIRYKTEEFSMIITAEHEKEIISWINPLSHDAKHAQNKLKLILRGNRDGFDKRTFYNKCKDIKNTVIVLKVQNTGEILGGYNPLTWNGGNKYKKTDKSLIFSLENEQSSSMLIRVKYSDYAICSCNENIGPSFGFLDLYMSDNEKAWGCHQSNYEKPIRNTSEQFQIEDYEVFRLS